MDENETLLAPLRGLVEQLHKLWIEKEACAKLAVKHGATYPEVEEAKQTDLDNPTIQQETREQFSEMWSALERGAQTLRFSDLLQSLPSTDKPN